MARKLATKKQKRRTVANAVEAWRQRQKDKGLMAVIVYVPPEHKDQIRQLEKALQRGARIT